ncbi:MAG: hypothetical protein EZS28_032417 [Streblomastix strix]|uniref:Uncharacterized protein n=1 Tax=Streblomastix strix TaxID=222440 RepID=A0A5J4UNQ5_9EUKA|nr:MAG: hypothetical protein EZS28_032417 [Streblomastix strix]
MIIEGQKFNTQKKYMQTIGVFDDWMKGKKLYNTGHNELEDTIHTYVIHDLVNQNKKNKAVISKAPRINTQHNAFSHIWYSTGLHNYVKTHRTRNFQSLDQQSMICEYLGHQLTV